MSVLGDAGLSREGATQLLRDANDDLDTAVTMFYSNSSSYLRIGQAGPSTNADPGPSTSADRQRGGGQPAATRDQPSKTKVQELRDILGENVGKQRLRKLLQCSNWDVQRAANLHYEGSKYIAPAGFRSRAQMEEQRHRLIVDNQIINLRREYVLVACTIISIH